MRKTARLHACVFLAHSVLEHSTWTGKDVIDVVCSTNTEVEKLLVCVTIDVDFKIYQTS